MSVGKKILLITGSMNQTLQMLRIANELKEYECWFSQMFTDSRLINFLKNNTGLLNKTIISNAYRKKAEDYLGTFHCRIDYGAKINKYDLVIFCSDLLVPERLLSVKTMWIQEGMIDRSTLLTRLVKLLKLPPVLCFNTSLNGATNTCDIYCTASEGYRASITKMGTDASKVYVTGIPNYDNLAQHLNNSFPHKDYVMVATTDMRETTRRENRPKFIKECVAIAGGRQLLFKLHPNENFDRAIREIKEYAPADTLIYTEGNTNDMIANCCELITQYSTVVYTGIALGKKVHSWFEVPELERLVPLQNGGSSAANIAGISKEYIEFTGERTAFYSEFRYHPVVPGVMLSIENKQLYAG